VLDPSVPLAWCSRDEQNFCAHRTLRRLDMSDIEREVQRLEEGEAWEETDEAVDVEVKRPLDKVIPTRLPSDTWEELRREARELGVGPTTLARMWVLERLRQITLAREST